jgi:DNA polymerase III alpha subunit
VLKYSDGNKDDASPQALKHLVKSYGIDIVYPTIHGYAPDFEPADQESHIYWPLRAIKGIGQSVIGELCKDGRRGFDSIEEMMEECDLRKVHKGVVGKLIKAGFFDPIAPPWEVAEIYFKIRDEQGYNDDGIPYDLAHKNKFRWYQARNDAYSMIVKPWKEVAPFHEKVQTYTEARLSRLSPGKPMFIGGYVEDMRVDKTKNGGWYARVTVVDEGEEYNVMMWPGFFEDRALDHPDSNGNIHRPWKGQLIELTGNYEEWNGRSQVILNSPSSHCRVIWDEMDLPKVEEL